MSLADGKRQSDLGDLIEEANTHFDMSCQQRHDMGREKYGPVKFLEIDSIEMGLEEIVDLANYARYTFIKLYLLREQLKSALEPSDTGFVPNSKSE